jgi:hypothetical protein
LNFFKKVQLLKTTLNAKELSQKELSRGVEIPKNHRPFLPLFYFTSYSPTLLKTQKPLKPLNHSTLTHKPVAKEL